MKKKTASEEKKVLQRKSINGRKIVLWILWILFIAAFVFAVYKNFTAVDIHTVHETKVVESRLSDTSSIQSFVSNFINEFYTYSNNDDVLRARNDKLANYMTDDLVTLNSDLVSGDDEVKSTVISKSVWGVEEQGDNFWEVKYSVRQQITTTKVTMQKQTVTVEKDGKEVTKEVEKPKTENINSNIESDYSVTVYVDENKNMIIVKNPTITSVPSKADYKNPEYTNDTDIDGDTSNEITHFLETFFEAYPRLDSSAMKYYAVDGVLPVINKDYTYDSLKQTIYRKDGDKIKVYVTVVYKNSTTGLKEYSQYILGLEKNGDNWQITSSDYAAQ